jgi:CheY-like chemotaxis protein
MAAEVIARVYEPFFTTKPVGVGTGLGLPMVYAFARQFGGCVQIESEMMRGTEVRIYLPRSLGEVDAGPDSVGHRAEYRPGDDEVVLVVEDDQYVRSLVMEVLQDHGYHGISATDGVAGLHILESEARIDLLITDVVLPGLNGRKLVKVARRRRPNLKALLMSGYAAEISAATSDDDIQMLAKPFTVDQLLAHIRQRAPAT